MPIPTIYGNANPISANYDYFDVAEGSGIKNFYAAVNDCSQAITGILTTDSTAMSGHFDPVFTFSASYDGASGAMYETQTHFMTTCPASFGATGNPVISRTFQVTMNMPKIIAGTANLTIPTRFINMNTGKTASMAIYATIYRNTDIIGAASGAVVQIVSPYNLWNKDIITSIKMPMTTTRIRKGDVIKLKVDLYGAMENNNGNFAMGHDPAGRDPFYNYWRASTSRLTCGLPFRIDL